MSNTFILGIGSQKAGTSWLHKFMRQSSNFNEGFTKEYHIWDAVSVPAFEHFRVKRRLFMKSDEKMRHRMQKSPDYYFDYFQSLYDETHDLAADISPNYSALSAEIMSSVKKGFTERGIACKAVLLIRDPVERCKSVVQSDRNQGKRHGGVEIDESNYCDSLRSYYQTEHAALRTRYDHTIQAMNSAFSPEERYIGIYENMFEKEQIERLASFLGVEARTDFGSKRVNRTTGERMSCPEVEAEMLRHFQPVYDFCFEQLPETRKLWRQPDPDNEA